MRFDERNFDELRNVRVSDNYLIHPTGSVLIEMGNTKVICTAMIEDKVPFFLKNSGTGWITAEYSMLPASTNKRKIRDASRGKIDGRTQEIQRLIGRALRTVIDLSKIGERTIWIDCDVIQADGGTRTASITGGYIAMVQAINGLYKKGDLNEFPISSYLGAISVGVYNGKSILDLCYEEDSKAFVDMNIVMNDKGEFVEIQGTGEESTFTRKELNELLDLGEKGILELIEMEKQILGPEINRLIKGDGLVE